MQNGNGNGAVENPYARRYPAKAILFAQRLAEDPDARLTDIKGELARFGYTPTHETVRRWIDEDFANRKRIRQRKGGRKPWMLKYDRMQELRAAGLSFTSVAKVMQLDYGIELSGERIRSWLAGKQEMGTIARALTERTDTLREQPYDEEE